jgi:hypothetical protein
MEVSNGMPKGKIQTQAKARPLRMQEVRCGREKKGQGLRRKKDQGRLSFIRRALIFSTKTTVVGRLATTL